MTDQLEQYDTDEAALLEICVFIVVFLCMLLLEQALSLICVYCFIKQPIHAEAVAF